MSGGAASFNGYLLDTSVISALAPGRELHLPAGFSDWLLARAERLFVPCIAVAELEQGICKLRRAGAILRAERLGLWLDGLVQGYGERILPLNAPVARLAGRLSEAAMAQGRHPGFADVAIAAIARHAELLLLTCNIKHFEPLGIPCRDPLAQLPE